MPNVGLVRAGRNHNHVGSVPVVLCLWFHSSHQIFPLWKTKATLLHLVLGRVQTRLGCGFGTWFKFNFCFHLGWQHDRWWSMCLVLCQHLGRHVHRCLWYLYPDRLRGTFCKIKEHWIAVSKWRLWDTSALGLVVGAISCVLFYCRLYQVDHFFRRVCI